nr:MAG TPA: hypothetical protein [Caudoviricetes sp.]
MVFYLYRGIFHWCRGTFFIDMVVLFIECRGTFFIPFYSNKVGG